MFKCLDSQAQREVILLDPEWVGSNLQRLRAKGQAQALLCPECKQSVIVKAGGKKRTHFAHKALGSCPLHSESPAVLQARAILYHWLRLKFSVKTESLFDQPKQPVVTVEKMVDPRLPRPVDCYVELPDGKKIAYWVLEKGMRDRDSFKSCFSVISLNVVFLSNMMRPMQGEEGQTGEGLLFDLTPTERDFFSESKYNGIYRPSIFSHSAGGSLHYLNPETAVVTTLRGLDIDHPPQRYAASAVLVHPLSEMLTNKTGEFIHPVEHEKLLVYEKAVKEMERKVPNRVGVPPAAIGASVRPEIPVDLPVSEPPQPAPMIVTKPLTPEEQERAELNHRRLRGLEPMTCRVCGRKTTNWTNCSLADSTCLCRDCAD